MKKIIIESILIAVFMAIILFAVGSFSFASFNISNWDIKFRAASSFFYVIITFACIGANVDTRHRW